MMVIYIRPDVWDAIWQAIRWPMLGVLVTFGVLACLV